VNDHRLSTLADLPFQLSRRPDRPALIRRSMADGFRDLSGQQFCEAVREVSLGLADLGVAPGDRIAIMSDSRPEWSVTDLGIITAGAVTVPIYPTLAAAQAQFILNDSEAKIAVVSDPIQQEKLEHVWSRAPALKAIAVIEPGRPGGDRVMTWDDLRGCGRNRLTGDPDAARRYQETAAAVTPDRLATIIYTSGTTGDPKGVMLSHHNLVSNAEASQAVIAIRPEDVALSFLPLSHSFERLVMYIYLSVGTTVVFAESLETVARDLAATRPTVMTGVPRVYEKLYGRVMETAEQGSPLKRRIFHWALGVGKRRARVMLEGRSVPPSIRLQYGLADRLVFSKIRERTGGRIRYFVSGAAPLPVDVAEFFFAAGMSIIEGYGLTETSPVLSVNPPGAVRLGTVGKPIPGVEIRIATDGEILARGPNIMLGYYQKPEATAEAIRDGWFHTGDVGTLDADGYLRITDRKKDLIVTSGGKNIAPQPIEGLLKRDPLVAEAVLIGDRRKFPVVLIAPDFPALEARLREMGMPGGSREEMVQRPKVRDLYQAVLDGLNQDLSRFEQIKKFALIPAEFSVAGGELTPTMKVRRKIVEQRWGQEIEQLYATRE
jgi:long-chain acyl-CoA synthetase